MRREQKYNIHTFYAYNMSNSDIIYNLYSLYSQSIVLLSKDQSEAPVVS